MPSQPLRYSINLTIDGCYDHRAVDGGDLQQAVRQLKQQPGRGLLVGGVTLPLQLAQWGLIDEYEFIVHPVIAGHGPALFAGLPQPLALQLVDRQELGSGAVVLRYVPKNPAPTPA